MNRQDYFSHPAVSRGALLPFKDSPRAGKKALENKIKDTSAMAFGRAFHLAMEGKFSKEFHVLPSDEEICIEIGGAKPRSTTAYKNWVAEQEKEANGRSLISSEDFSAIMEMRNNILDSDFYNKVCPAGTSYSDEVPFYANIEGVEFKCLADRVIDRGNDILIIDWKTTRASLSNNSRVVIRELLNYDLPFQAIHYSRVIEAATGKPVTFVFMFSENHGGHDCLPVIISKNSEIWFNAEQDYNRALENFKHFRNGNVFGVEKLVDNGILIIE